MGSCQARDAGRGRSFKNRHHLLPCLNCLIASIAKECPYRSPVFISCIDALTLEAQVDEPEAVELIHEAIAGGDTAVAAAWSRFITQDRPYLTTSSHWRVVLIRAWLRRHISAEKCRVRELVKLVTSLDVSDFPLVRDVKKSLRLMLKADGLMNYAGLDRLVQSLMDWNELRFVWTAVTEGAHVVPRSSKTNLDVPINVKLFLDYVQLEDTDDTTLKCFAAHFDGSLAITRLAFMQYLADPLHNSALDPTHQRQVYHDMSQPLSYYFINSSHRTYLSGDQVASTSNAAMYSMVLRAGSRYVELDCWDGKDGQPVVYHGYTRAKSTISFTDVVRVINQDAFIASPYPVIVALEVHASPEQQEVMAKTLVDVFGTKLATRDADDLRGAVTPESLKNKILLKGRRRGSVPPTSHVDGADPVRDDGNLQVAAVLSDLLFIEEVPSKGLANLLANEHGGDLNPYECASLPEGKSASLAEHHLDEFINYNSQHLTRVAPSSRRIDSSNHHPLVHWSGGVQIVPLNWQTEASFELRLNKARFRDNGNSGYLLKPPCALGQGSRPVSKYIEVEVVSGYALAPTRKAAPVVSLFVRLFVDGPKTGGSSATAQRTCAIRGDGGHPVWHGTEGSVAVLHVPVPELSTIVLQIVDEKDDRMLGEALMPVTLLRYGVRCMQLRDVASDTVLHYSRLILRIRQIHK